MRYEFTESHFVLEFPGKCRIRMTLDEADRLRAVIEQNLYRRDKQFKKIKEQQCAFSTSRNTTQVGEMMKGL